MGPGSYVRVEVSTCASLGDQIWEGLSFIRLSLFHSESLTCVGHACHCYLILCNFSRCTESLRQNWHIFCIVDIVLFHPTSVLFWPQTLHKK